MTYQPRRSLLLALLLLSVATRLVPFTLVSMAVFLPLLFSRVGLVPATPSRRLAVQRG